MPKTVLVVDDDPLILDMLRLLLTGAGYEVDLASTVQEAQRKVLRRPPAIAVVDVELREESGLDLVRLWRTQPSFPVLVLSGLGSAMDRVVGLELGADDYLVKPFEPRELILRLRLLIARAKPAAFGEVPIVWTLGQGQFDQRRRCLHLNGQEIALSTAEFKLVGYLVAHANQAVTRDQILDAVQHRDRQSSDRAVDVLIGRLRKKLVGSNVNILPIRGLGYMLCGEVQRQALSPEA
jgi:DNA-binding response OmpR family regulator